jgi:hypothetical protein
MEPAGVDDGLDESGMFLRAWVNGDWALEVVAAAAYIRSLDDF